MKQQYGDIKSSERLDFYVQFCHSMTGAKGLEPVKTERPLEKTYGILKKIDGAPKEIEW